MKKLDVYLEFSTASQCADAAAPVFTEHRWRWARIGVPSRDAILNTLEDLESDLTRGNYEVAQTGRLFVAKRGRSLRYGINSSMKELRSHEHDQRTK